MLEAIHRLVPDHFPTESAFCAFLSNPYETPYTFAYSEVLKPAEDEALVRIDYCGSVTATSTEETVVGQPHPNGDV